MKTFIKDLLLTGGKLVGGRAMKKLAVTMIAGICVVGAGVVTCNAIGVYDSIDDDCNNKEVEVNEMID